MSDMRRILDLLNGSAPKSTMIEAATSGPFSFFRFLMEGDVVRLGDEKKRRDDEKLHKAMTTYVDSLNGVVDGMRARHEANGGKFASLLKDLVDGRPPRPWVTEKDLKLSFYMMVSFRDFKLGPDARNALNMLKKQRAEIRFTKYHKEFRGTKTGPHVFVNLTPEQAAEIFRKRDNPEIIARYGVYQPSALGFGNATHGSEQYSDAGIGFQIAMSNYFDQHALDNDQDLDDALRIYKAWLTWKNAPNPLPKPKVVSSNDAPAPTTTPSASSSPEGPQGEFDLGPPHPQARKPSLRVVR